MAEVQQSANDKRLYRHIKLSNGLRALLISDPETKIDTNNDEQSLQSDSEKAESHSDTEEEASATDAEQEQHVKKAAAALAVGTGSFSDPDEVQGLSHYLEHMLFMGSEKYPDENEYDSYLAKHGGSSNAFTEMEYTNYHFDVKPDRLHGALDRFAQFFIQPLCKAGALEREVQAVNNEFIGVQQSDACRLAQLRCHTAKEGHMYRKFTWGNRKSLVEQPAAAKIDVRNCLLDYYSDIDGLCPACHSLKEQFTHWQSEGSEFHDACGKLIGGYRTKYGAERMSLAVLGGDSLDTLEEWVQELFSKIPSGPGSKRSFRGTEPPYQGSQVYLLPAVKQAHDIVATFQLPSLSEEYLAKADDYLSNLIGHEGAGSLLSALKTRNWATALSAGVSEGGYERNTALYVFEVSITLTEAGLDAVPGLGLAVVSLLFEYLGMLRAAGPQQWLYQELADIGAMKARFLEEDDAMDYVTGIASNMLYVRPEHTLLSDFLYEDWRPEVVTELLGRMTPREVRVDIQTSEFERLAEDTLLLPGATKSCEPWFGLPFVSAGIPNSILDQWERAGKEPSQELHFPPRNTFIPTDFSLQCEQESGNSSSIKGPSKRQKKIGSNGQLLPAAQKDSDLGIDATAQREPPEPVFDGLGARLWHKLDRAFRTPRACAHFMLSTLSAYASPRDAAATHLALSSLHDALNKTTYLADIAGLQYDIWLEGRTGIEVKLDGFSHKLPLLTQTVFKALADFKVARESFARVKEALVRKYRNANLMVERHATYLRLRALKPIWDVNEILKELQLLKPEDIQDIFRQSVQHLHVESLMEGNMTAADSTELLKALLAMFDSKPLAVEERPLDQIAELPPGTSHLIRQRAKNAEEDNSAAELYFQCGIDNVQLRATLDLLEQIASEPCFNTLRTQEQLGYSVSCGLRLTGNVLGFAVVILSGSHAPSHLDERIEAFLASFQAELENLSAEEFERNREALIAAKMQKDRSLQDHVDRHWEQISNRRYRFSAREEEVQVLEGLTKTDVQNCYQRFLKPGSHHRARLAVHIVGRQNSADLQQPAPRGITIAKDPEKLRSSLKMHPAPQVPALKS